MALVGFRALILLVGHQEEHLDCKNLSDEVLVWLSIRSEVHDLHMVQLMPMPPHHLLLHLNVNWFNISGASLQSVIVSHHCINCNLSDSTAHPVSLLHISLHSLISYFCHLVITLCFGGLLHLSAAEMTDEEWNHSTEGSL